MIRRPLGCLERPSDMLKRSPLVREHVPDSKTAHFSYSPFEFIDICRTSVDLARLSYRDYTHYFLSTEFKRLYLFIDADPGRGGVGEARRRFDLPPLTGFT